MCAILDSNVKGELTAPSGDAGAAFYEWLMSGQGKIVVGGTKMRAELYVHPVERDSRLMVRAGGWRILGPAMPLAALRHLILGRAALNPK